MKNYFRIMLGKKSIYAEECIAGNFIGANFGIKQDLSNHLADDWRDFNREFIRVFLANNPDKSKVAAGLACGVLWTISKFLDVDDIILSPDGMGHYHVGSITGGYSYHPNGILPHRRSVQWFNQIIDRVDMSEYLRRSTGSIGTVSNITKYANEIERLLEGITEQALIATDETIEDPSAFAMEKHLEDFLIQNWPQSGLGKEFDIYQEDGESGQQFLTDTGPLDILAISKDKKTLLVVELKKGRASDVVVGQILRYMGYVQEVLAEENQQVKGVIIALEDDPKIRRALAMVPNIDFYRYQISFKLVKA